MFLGCNKLVGAIKYSSNCTDGNYANTVNGYFTLKGTVSRPKKVYAEFTTADNTLTFKFSEEPTSTEGITIYNIPESGTSKPDWSTIATSIKKVAFDDSFADVNPRTCRYWFSGCSNLTEIKDIQNLNTSIVTDMAYMFDDCKNLKSLDLSSFNTNNVSDMSRMFYNCSSLTTLDLSNFNTNNVSNMSSMFYYCSSLTTLNLNSFNTNNVSDMSSMFRSCLKLTTLDLSNFNTEKVTTMDYMFCFCPILKTIYVSDKFTTNNVSSSMEMFYDCSQLVGAIPFSSSTIDKTHANYKTGYFKTYCKVGDTKYDMCGEKLKVDNLSLSDGDDFVAYVPFTATNISYTRAASTATWGSLCLPFDYTPSGFDAYQLTNMDEGNSTITLTQVSGQIAAGTPILYKKAEKATDLDIKATDASIVTMPVEGTATELSNLKLVGTYQEKTFTSDDNNCFILKNNQLMNPAKLLANSKVKKVGLKAYRAYVVNEGSTLSSAKAYNIAIYDEATFIDQLNMMTTEGAKYYDMNGCRTDGLKKGLNIVKKGEKTMKIIIK
ncbi:MAG: BspA family leucine-rich repeat surface protein [Prevotella sp.]|nr:BspA family leucine-rich repeat surface protein [Prevotella sp.]